MGFTKDNLSKGERVIYTTSLHWIIFLESISILIIGLFILYLGRSYAQTLGGAVLYVDYMAYAVLIFGAVKFLLEFIRHSTSEFVVTTQRIFIKVGVLKQSSLAMPLSKIESIEVDQSIMGQLMGFGTLHITGTGTATSKFDLINNPTNFRRKMQLASGSGSDEDKQREVSNYRRKRRR